ncbi:MAG: hypothetical protein GF417_00190, partial [Candidatus Latescibacteria bacterium]|nr:hypothetical protein [bacterium]MBD3422846.1 hypothetical protein [Candidatus Latescibacterota bacterium]
VIFILFVFILRSDWKWFAGKRILIQWIVALAAAVVLGLATEVIQSFIGREFDRIDILRDLAGALVGLLLLTGVHGGGSKLQKAAGHILIGIILLIVSVPLFLSMADELVAARQFPLLSGFETPLEIDRWRCDGSISVSGVVSRTGRSSLRAELTTRRYSRITMRYSLGDWRGYSSLTFSIYNPDSTELEVICRIHDQEHEELGSPYADRFHRRVKLERGWNDIRIPVEEIREAPAGRDIDLQSIDQLSFFSVSLPETRYIYLDDIRLLKGEGVGGTGP